MSIQEELDKLASNELRALLSGVDSQGKLNAIHRTLSKREEAQQHGLDAGQILLDTLGGEAASTLHAKALDAVMRHADAKRFLEAEKAYGVANALWDYIRERSDT